MPGVFRNYRKLPSGKCEHYGNYFTVFYDPERRPPRKKVNLRTRDKSGARIRAADYHRRHHMRTYDPWKDAAPEEGVTVGEAVERYLGWKRRRKAKKTCDNDQRTLAQFERWLPAGCLVKHVSSGDVDRFINEPKRDGAPRAGTTRLRYLRTLSDFLTWAKREGMTREVVAAGVERPKADRTEKDYLTEAEEEALVRTIRAQGVLIGQPVGWLVDWVRVGIGTGLRPGEQAGLRWGSVRLKEGVIVVGKSKKTKTGDQRRVQVRGAALETLSRMAAERVGEADGPVFVPISSRYNGGSGRKRTEKTVNTDYVTKQLQKYAGAAGIAKNITAYSLRHTYGTRMMGGRVPVLTLARLMGTSVQMIERHYGHHDPDAAAAAVESVFGGGALTGA